MFVYSRFSPLTLAVLGLCHALPTHSEEIERLESVTALGTQDAVPHIGGPLADRLTPQSRLDQEAIRELVTPMADFATLARMTPSYNDSAPNGEGFDAAKNQTLRGFVDGQFGLTVDGIPLQDPDTFQHHSTSYFPAATLESVVVDRSPGGATDLGYATAGGTIQLNTLNLPTHANAQAYGSVGSFATTLIGTRLSTAAPTASGETGLLVNAEHRQSAGALANSDARRDDVLLKGVWLPATDFKVTGLFSFDRYHYNNPPSVSEAQLAAQGPSAGFGATPGQPDFYGYAATNRRAAFGYVRVEGTLGGGWSLDEKVYQYYYASRGLGTIGDTTSSPIGKGKGAPATDIALYLTNVDYTTVGNILQFAHADTSGTAHLGVWLDHSSEAYFRDFVDGTTGLLYNGSKGHTPVYAQFSSHLDTVQPYLDYEWQASPDLRIRPGVRYQQVRRGLVADVIQRQAVGTNGEVTRTVTSTLPSLDLNYRLDAQTHLLAEVAKGVQVPNQAFFYTATPATSNQAAPQSDVAYQLGLVHDTGSGNVGLTAYVIHFQDYIATTTLNGVTVSQNSGSVLYRGLEFEGRQEIAMGWEALANASAIRAEYQQAGMASAAQKAGDDVPLVPSYLAHAGVVYRHGGWQGSLLARFVGVEYQGSGGSSNVAQRVEPYHAIDLTLTRFIGSFAGLDGARVTLGVNNVQNQTPITDNGGLSSIASAGKQVNVLPQRNYTLSLVADF